MSDRLQMIFSLGGKIISCDPEACSRDQILSQARHLTRTLERFLQNICQTLVASILMVAAACLTKPDTLTGLIGDQGMGLGGTDINPEKVSHANSK
jgi:hypothetical protein